MLELLLNRSHLGSISLLDLILALSNLVQVIVLAYLALNHIRHRRERHEEASERVVDR